MNKKSIIPNSPMEIICLDDFSPEVVAMLQALYSRDPRSVLIHIQNIKEGGAEKFMSSYYVGYGHKSIGDCGTITLCVENVSMFTAKAIQDWPLYSGQEASTRYLDMGAQPVINILDTDEGKNILVDQMKFYSDLLETLIRQLPEEYPRYDSEDEKIYNKTIKAKAFDIARGFLPAGVTTYVSWHTNLRQAADHLKEMRYHPLREIREVAEKITATLKEKYPSSFGHKRYDKDEEYLEKVIPIVSFNDDMLFNDGHGELSATISIDTDFIKRYKSLFLLRPENSELPKQARLCGDVTFKFLLDFGSFRDWQRQRAVTTAMPLLSTNFGFEKWYLNQIRDTETRKYTERFISEMETRVNNLECSNEDRQYYIPMGYRTPCEVRGPISAAIYACELRTKQTVHPTLRIVAKQMGRNIEHHITQALGEKYSLHCDYSEDEWSLRRGTQDIVKKES
ncbi:MAG: hypothetical protein QG669_369 [Patescibacteria group bacterium]|jgi:thymidylate synthase ThyX|nr:hypothetical protein [Patescibacteria group bacterium]MDQ5961977.1 hypothetical protein [Patescibacteria group bacterium]